jgi:hypothetical protein
MNIVYTAASSEYYDSLLTLISSIHEYCNETVDRVVVYDIDLSSEQKDNLSNLLKVELRSDSIKYDSAFREDYMFKLIILKDSLKENGNVLWLDAGVCCLQDIKCIFNIIESEGIFCVEDHTQINATWTNSNCKEKMSVTSTELDQHQICSGIFGYTPGSIYSRLIEEAYEYGMQGCTKGSRDNHRHDQTVLSILTYRYNVKGAHIDTYGYYTNAERNLQTAKESNAVIFVHRKGHFDFDKLQYK